MKNIISFFGLISLFVSTIAFADPSNQPDFKCVEQQSGFQFHFYLKTGLIQIFDENGKMDSEMQGVSVKYRSIETMPTIDSYTFTNSRNESIAWIEFTENKSWGMGEMIDNDQKMNCVRK
jgi:hypothetical protein